MLIPKTVKAKVALLHAARIFTDWDLVRKFGGGFVYRWQAIFRFGWAVSSANTKTLSLPPGFIRPPWHQKKHAIACATGAFGCSDWIRSPFSTIRTPSFVSQAALTKALEHALTTINCDYCDGTGRVLYIQDGGNDGCDYYETWDQCPNPACVGKELFV